MNIHKFNVKPIYTPPKTIKWLIPDNIRQYVRKVNTTRAKYPYFDRFLSDEAINR